MSPPNRRETVLITAALKKYLAPVVAAGSSHDRAILARGLGMSGHDGLISKLVDLGKSDTGMRSTTAVKAQVFIEQAMRLVVTLVIKIINRSFRRFVVTRPI